MIHESSLRSHIGKRPVRVSGGHELRYSHPFGGGSPHKRRRSRNILTQYNQGRSVVMISENQSDILNLLTQHLYPSEFNGVTNRAFIGININLRN